VDIRDIVFSGVSCRWRAQAIIDRGAADVFQFVADVTNEPRWRGEIQSVEATSSGPTGLGSTFRKSGHLLGRAMVADAKVIEYDEPRHVAIENRSGPYLGILRYTLAERGSGTSITLAVDLRIVSRWGRFLGPLALLGARTEVAQLGRLKTVIEQH
jgi:polyketide cyclase/dehydrase/lipid transport protein